MPKPQLLKRLEPHLDQSGSAAPKPAQGAQTTA
jgi:hypothetical protein